MRWLGLLLLVLVTPMLSACASTRGPATYLVDVKGPYQLDSGDVLRVTVYGDEQLTGTYRIDDAGSVAFPLVGPVQVRGKTTKTAGSAIAAALANGFMRNPNVAVEVNEYRPFFIQGEVGQSGKFPYEVGMTVRSAISLAGGFSDTADRSKAVVYRRQGETMAKGKVELDFPISPGDTIVVLERWL